MTTEILTTEACMQLLRQQKLGRLAVVVGNYPMVVPVNYALDRDTIVFRSGPGTKLTAAQHRNVAFQVDEIDTYHQTGWSVLVTGTAEVVTDRHDESLVARTRALDIRPMERGDKDLWVRIIPNAVSGRRVSGSDGVGPLWGSEAYL